MCIRDSAFIDRLVAEVSKGFRGDVGVVPRQFLREFVTQLDLVEEDNTYMPMEIYGFDPDRMPAATLSPEEQRRLGGRSDSAALDSEEEESGRLPSDSAPLEELEEGPELIPTEDVW